MTVGTTDFENCRTKMQKFCFKVANCEWQDENEDSPGDFFRYRNFRVPCSNSAKENSRERIEEMVNGGCDGGIVIATAPRSWRFNQRYQTPRTKWNSTESGARLRTAAAIGRLPDVHCRSATVEIVRKKIATDFPYPPPWLSPSTSLRALVSSTIPFIIGLVVDARCVG